MNRVIGVALSALFAGACATGPFVRPTLPANVTPQILDEATGRTFTDCKAAFAEATGETVLRFSAGVFDCGPEVRAQSEFLIVRGAGLGHTFLAADDAKDRLHLAAIDPGHTLRVEDLAFGGLGPQPSTDAVATLVRVAVATDRPVLFGGSDGVLGTVMVLHSWLAKTTGSIDPGDQYPKPVAYNGNERVAIVESVLSDVEQEFERYPAPGSVELLDDAIQASFELHDPASGHRKDASHQTNVTCGNKKGPEVVCPGQNQRVDGDSPVMRAAKLVADGRPVAELEAPLREAGQGFASRFDQTLAQDVRQPDLFWFDDAQAKVVEEESQLDGRAADAVLLRARSADLLARCADPTAQMRDVLGRARGLDRLVGDAEITKACVEKIRPRAKAVVDECRTSLDWAGALAKVKDLDDALGDQGQSVRACTDALRARANQLAKSGPLARVYLREVSRVLDLGASAGAATEHASLSTVSASLPWIVSRAALAPNLPANPSVLDLVIHAALQPNSGDGRRLVDQTAGCKLVDAGGGAKKATGAVVLAEALPNAAPTDVARVVLQLPVEATVDDLPPGTDAGAVNVQLVSTCEAKEAAAYPAALGRYVADELARQATAGNVRARVDSEVALFIVGGASATPKNLPLVPEALQVVASDLARTDESLGVSSTDVGQARPAEAPVPKSTAKSAPAWSMDRLMRAADLVSRSGELNLAACSFLLSDVPWQIHEQDLTGAVVLDGVPSRLVCQTSERGFQLSVWVDGPTPKRVRILAALERALTKKLGPPTVMSTGYGPAVGWNATAEDRTAFVFRAVPPESSMLGYLLVPLGSDWRYR